MKKLSSAYTFTAVDTDYNAIIIRYYYLHVIDMPTFYYQDYALTFGLWAEHASNKWHGGVASIEPCPGEEVWGVVWSMSNQDMANLDQ